MSWPIHLVFVRHGQSEWNVAYEADRAGNPEALQEIASSDNPEYTPLTIRGRQQAILAGEWLRKQPQLASFDRYLVSPYPRALETAMLLDYNPMAWQIVQNLRERSWGDLLCISRQDPWYKTAFAGQKIDPVNWRPWNGETLVESRERAEFFLNAMETDGSFSALCVTHGEFITVLKCCLEGFTEAEFFQEAMSHTNQHSVKNGHVLWYTRQNPETGVVHSRYRWRYSICPWDPKGSPNTWIRIEHQE